MLNTAVKVTYKDGQEVEYPSIEEASNATGLSESAIKIRCNKSRQGSSNKKDGITCMWIDDHTFRSFNAKRSKRRGSGLELSVIKDLNDIGYSNLKTSRSESRTADNNKIDIVSLDNSLPVNIQCKYTQTTPNYFGIEEECSDKSKPFVVIWKKSGIDKTIAMIPYQYFLSLLKQNLVNE